MIFKVKIGGIAKRDAREIRRYIAEQFQAPLTADNYFERIVEAILSLREMPERYRLFFEDPNDSVKWSNLRMMVVGSYRVLYTVNPNKREVFVHRILYGKRDIQSLLL